MIGTSHVLVANIWDRMRLILSGAASLSGEPLEMLRVTCNALHARFKNTTAISTRKESSAKGQRLKYQPPDLVPRAFTQLFNTGIEMGVKIISGDCREVLRTMPDQSVHCVVTSPPYFGLRDYGVAGQIGLEETPEAFVAEMLSLFSECRRVLRDDGTLWLNLGDSYAGSGKGAWNNKDDQKEVYIPDSDSPQSRMAKTWDGIKAKDLIGIPWRVAFALQADGWYLRDAIVWAKPNGMPGSQQDRCTSSYEMIFQLSKSKTYWSDFDAIKTPPRESSLVRTAQDLQAQAGSHRANGGGKTNGTMKAVGVKAKSSTLEGGGHGRHSYGENLPERERRSDKQRGHVRVHVRVHAGFNDRWDAMPRAEQQSQPVTMRNVWFVSPAQFKEAHYAVMPEEIARRCIVAGCPEGGTVLDPFGGAGTTGLVADKNGRNAILIELNPANTKIAERRIDESAGLFAYVETAEVA